MDRPILFSAPMVRALLAGTKTQTRRVVKPQPAPHESWDWSWPVPGKVTPGTRICWRDDVRPNLFPYCPHGVPGDRLWVRETCRAEELSLPPQSRPATRRERERLGRTSVIELHELDGTDGVRYLADNAWAKIENTAAAGEAWTDLYHYRGRGKAGIGNQVPSIHMPRWASRLTLTVTDVRVERLQDISADDADAECFGGDYPGVALPDLFPGPADRWGHLSIPECYGRLWESINGPGAWATNPWVWAVSFEVAGHGASGSRPCSASALSSTEANLPVLPHLPDPS